MGWGVSLLGFGQVIDALNDIQVRLSDDAVYVVGSDLEYSIYVELGTRRMEAQPYLFPAARSVQRDIAQVAAQASSMEEAVKLVALEIERRASENAPVDTGALKASIRTEKVR